MFPISTLINPNSASVQARRNLGKRVYNWFNEGVQYPGFKYYPRHGDSSDPPYEPSKLFRVQRIKPVKGTPYWERHILQQYKLTEKMSDIAIVKNTPESNAALWRIKHLIKVTPITFPNGMPEDENGTFLKENGELVVIKKISGASEREAASENFENDPKKLNGDTLRRELRRRWMTGWS